MIHRADLIKTFLQGVSHAAFQKGALVRSAVERQLGIIGEAAACFSEQARRRYPEVPWASIVGARQYIIHQYWIDDPEMTWDLAKKDVPDLARLLRKRALTKTSAHLDDEIMTALRYKKAKRK